VTGKAGSGKFKGADASRGADASTGITKAADEV